MDNNATGFRNGGVTFWHWNIGHLVTIIIFLLGIAGSMWSLSIAFERRFNKIEEIASKAADNATQLTLVVRQMDDRGTRKSQQDVQADSALSKSNTDRIAVLEAEIQKMSPLLQEISTNQKWMMEAMRAHDQRIPK